MKNKSVLYLTRTAVIASLYVVLTLLSTVFGLSSGVIQFRFSEMLCILPIFLPEACVGLTLGCAIANMLTPGVVIWDVIFGAVATLIGAVGARLLKSLPEKLKFIATLPTVLANAFIVPLVLLYAYGIEGGYWFFFLTVGIGEFVCATIMGTGLYYTLKKTNIIALLK